MRHRRAQHCTEEKVSSARVGPGSLYKLHLSQIVYSPERKTDQQQEYKKHRYAFEQRCAYLLVSSSRCKHRHEDDVLQAMRDCITQEADVVVSGDEYRREKQHGSEEKECLEQ